MRFLKLFFYVLLIVLGVSFAALNASYVKINFYIKEINIPIAVLLIVTLALGIMIGFFIFYARYLRLKHECKKVKHQLDITEREIRNLRAIPLDDKH